MAVRMRAGDAPEGRHDALGHRLVGLAVLPARSPVPPAAEGLRGPVFHVLATQALPGSDIHLPELRIETNRGPEALADDPCRVGGPSQVTAVDHVDGGLGQPVGETLRLDATRLGQGPVGVSLPAALGVPVALTVACKQDSCHRLIVRGTPTGDRGLPCPMPNRRLARISCGVTNPT